MPFEAARCSRVAMLGMLLISAGCAATPDAELITASPPLDQRPSDGGIALGKKHYAAGDYGLAERHFRAAVESNPQSAGAWLGLAAAYDHLSRFDLAERAYLRTIDLQGKTPAVLNNLGYHYLLRGQLATARKHLLAAAAMDPNNPQIQGNLRLLETWKTGS
jgi:Flp pilus assembly protein TadD